MPKAKPSRVRAGGTPLTLQNSGLEVWLYDEANRDRIRTPRGKKDQGAGGMPPDFDAKTKEGLIVGYSLYQDDAVSVRVYVGDPFTTDELSAGRWLEPQTALLKLPSGTLCIEPNDGSRIGPEEPGQEGGIVKVPKGDYRLTLYRVDHEALDRAGIEWNGPQELILLTPGGKKSDAAREILPFKERRDNSWVGKYVIQGKTAQALVWFPDYWDTFILNLDARAVRELGLATGSYLQTQVPDTGHTLVSTYGKNWDEAKRIPRPAGVSHDEFGYAALLNFQDWEGAEGMYCRREKAKTVVEDKHKNVWLPCTVQVLDAKPMEIKATARGFIAADFAEKAYYEADSGFLSLIISEVLPGVEDLDDFPLPKALKRLDKDFAKLGLKPVGDFQWEETVDDEPCEMTARLYVGHGKCFGAVIGQEMNIHIGFWTEKEDGQWIVTGLLDDFANLVKNAAAKRAKGPTAVVKLADADLKTMLSEHEEHIADQPVKKAPRTSDEVEGAFKRFLTSAFG